MDGAMEESWREFEQTGSIRSYLKYRGAADAAFTQNGETEEAQQTAQSRDTTGMSSPLKG